MSVSPPSCPGVMSFGLRGALLCVAIGVLGGCEAPINSVWTYRSQSASQSSPALAGSLVVFGTQSGEVHAVTRDGAFRWKFQTRKEVISAPAVTDNLILFGSTNYNFYALDFSGREVWKYLTGDRIKGDPLAIGSDVVFGSYDRHLYRMKAKNRGMVWAFPDDLFEKPGAESALNGSKPPVEDATTPPAGAGADGADAQKGAEDAPPPAPTVDKSQWPKRGFSYARPTLTTDGHIVVGNLDGYIYAVDAETGEFAWRFATDGAKQNMGITSTVAERDGTLFFGSNDGHVYALDLKTQAVKWKFKTGHEVNSSPVIDASGTLFIGSLDKKLYAIDSKTGAKKWEFFCEGAVKSRPALYQNLVLFGASEGDGHVYAVDKDTGKLFWKHKTQGAVDGDPLVDGDRFYIGSNDKKLYAFKINATKK